MYTAIGTFWLHISDIHWFWHLLATYTRYTLVLTPFGYIYTIYTGIVTFWLHIQDIHWYLHSLATYKRYTLVLAPFGYI